MPDYLARASLDFDWDYQHGSKGTYPTIPYNLPIDIGPFKLDNSPNKGIFLVELDLIEPHQLSQHRPDREYPVSLLCLELEIRDSTHAQAIVQADTKLEALECLLRLYQRGNISVRRHSSVWQVNQQKPSLESFLNVRPAKPRMTPLYGRPPYPLTDAVLADFVQFFNKHWSALSNAKRYLKTAMARFNSSYEKRDLSDRMVELVIALEALFGDRNPGSISHKLAMRCACWLHPAGQDRVKLFSQIKKCYGWRSKAVHGGEPGGFSEADVTKLEDVVRNSLLKFLDYRVREGSTPHGREIDDLIMLAKI